MLNPSIFVKVKCTFVSSSKIFLFSLWTGGNIDISDFGYIWSEVPLYQKCHLFLSYVANLEVKCFSFKTFERRHAAASQFVINKQSAKDRWLGYCLVPFWMYKHHGIGFSTLRPRQNVCSALLESLSSLKQSAFFREKLKFGSPKLGAIDLVRSVDRFLLGPSMFEQDQIFYAKPACVLN